jgi:hypothetical protein
VPPSRHGEELHEVVDDNVSKRSNGIVEMTTILNTETLGHRDLPHAT